MKTGNVAIIGKPNVGKSTFLNAVLGEKISIVSRRPATTRFRILGIKTTEDYQIIFMDTPGFEKVRNLLGRVMQDTVAASIQDSDVILFMMEGSGWRDEDMAILSKLKGDTEKPVILGINKVDKVSPRQNVLLLIEKSQEYFPFKEIVPLSALNGENVTDLEKTIVRYLPEGGKMFPEEYSGSLPEQYRVGETIREKVFESVYEEIPHGIAVEVEEMRPGRNNPDMMVIRAHIIVERENQKKIIIGKGGAKLKMIGEKSRRDLEAFLGRKVYLELWVKVIENWRERPDIFSRFGYGRF